MSEIVPLTEELIPLYNEHFSRHRAESGRETYHFMPFAPTDPDGPRGLSDDRLAKALDEPGWERWWIAMEGGVVIGHVDLKGDGLRTALHRCELGIGIESHHRGGGLGKRLMQTAIDFCVEEPSIAWLDLKVFGHNANARALYKQLGFAEIGVFEDRFRIDGESIDDVAMTLRVG